ETDRALLVVRLRIKLRLQPVADAVAEQVALSYRTASLDGLEMNFRFAIENSLGDAVKDQAIVIADLRQGDEVTYMVGSQVRVKGDVDRAEFRIQRGHVGKRCPVGRSETYTIPQPHDLAVELAYRFASHGAVGWPLIRRWQFARCFKEGSVPGIARDRL